MGKCKAIIGFAPDAELTVVEKNYYYYDHADDEGNVENQCDDPEGGWNCDDYDFSWDVATDDFAFHGGNAQKCFWGCTCCIFVPSPPPGPAVVHPDDCPQFAWCEVHADCSQGDECLATSFGGCCDYFGRRRLGEPEALGTSAVTGRRRLQGADLPPSPPPFPPSPPPSPPPYPPDKAPRSPPHAPQDTGIGDDLLPHGGFEIWYSDVSAFFGTKARTVLTGQQERTSVYAIDSTERGNYARGRYVTLRIYHPHKRLRLETMEVFGREYRPSPPPPLPPPSPPVQGVFEALDFPSRMTPEATHCSDSYLLHFDNGGNAASY